MTRPDPLALACVTLVPSLDYQHWRNVRTGLPHPREALGALYTPAPDGQAIYPRPDACLDPRLCTMLRFRDSMDVWPYGKRFKPYQPRAYGDAPEGHCRGWFQQWLVPSPEEAAIGHTEGREITPADTCGTVSFVSFDNPCSWYPAVPPVFPTESYEDYS